MKPLAVNDSSVSFILFLLLQVAAGSAPFSSHISSLTSPHPLNRDCFQVPNFHPHLRESRWCSYRTIVLLHPPSSSVGRWWPQITKHNFFSGYPSPWLFCSTWHWHYSLLTDIFSILIARIFCYSESSTFPNLRRSLLVSFLPISPNFIHIPNFSPRPSSWLDGPLLASSVPHSYHEDCPLTKTWIFTTDLWISPVQLNMDVSDNGNSLMPTLSSRVARNCMLMSIWNVVGLNEKLNLQSCIISMNLTQI